MSAHGFFGESAQGFFIQSPQKARDGGVAAPSFAARLYWDDKTRQFNNGRLTSTLNPNVMEVMIDGVMGGGAEAVVPVNMLGIDTTISPVYQEKGTILGALFPIDDATLNALLAARYAVTLQASHWGNFFNDHVILDWADLPASWQSRTTAGFDFSLTGLRKTGTPLPFACAYGSTLMMRPAYDNANTPWTASPEDDYQIVAIDKSESPRSWPAVETRALVSVLKGATLSFPVSTSTTMQFTIPLDDIGDPPQYFNLDGGTKRLLNYAGPCTTNGAGYKVYGFQLVNGVDHGDGTISCDMEFEYQFCSSSSIRVRWPQLPVSYHDLRETIYPPSPSDVTTPKDIGSNERRSELNADEIGGFYAMYQEYDENVSTTIIHENPVFPNVTIRRSDYTVDLSLGDVANWLTFNGTAFALGAALTRDADLTTQNQTYSYITNESSNPVKDQNVTTDETNLYRNDQHIEQYVDGQLEHIATIDYDSSYDKVVIDYGGAPPTEVTDNSSQTYSITWDTGKEAPINDSGIRAAFVTSEGTIWVDAARSVIWLRKNDGTAVQVYSGAADSVHTNDRESFTVSTNTLNKLNATTIQLSMTGWLANTNETSGQGSASAIDQVMGEHVRQFTYKFEPDVSIPKDISDEVGFPPPTITETGNCSLELGGLPCPWISGSVIGASLFWRDAKPGQDGLMIAQSTPAFRAAYETYQLDPTAPNRTAMEAEYTILLNNFASRRLIESCLMWEGNNVIV